MHWISILVRSLLIFLIFSSLSVAHLLGQSVQAQKSALIYVNLFGFTQYNFSRIAKDSRSIILRESWILVPLLQAARGRRRRAVNQVRFYCVLY